MNDFALGEEGAGQMNGFAFWRGRYFSFLKWAERKWKKLNETPRLRKEQMKGHVFGIGRQKAEF